MRWLHLTDLHFGFGEEPENDPMIRSMWDNLPKLTESIGKPVDCLFITGDLRYAKGCKDGRYPRKPLLSALKKIQEEFQIDPENTFVVPGNHDVNRVQANFYLDTVFKNYQASSRGFLSKGDLKMLQMGQKEFLKIRQEICGDKLSEWPHYATERNGFNIICLNTALLSGKDGEQGTLVLGQYLLDEMFRKIKNNKLPSIVLAHHSIDNLNGDEQRFLQEQLSQAHAVLYLCGHTHQMDVRADNNRGYHTFVGGTLLYNEKQGGTPDIDVLAGEIQPDGKMGYVRAFRWEKRIYQWLPDPVFSYLSSQGNATDGVYYFPKRPDSLCPRARNAGMAYLDYLKKQCGKIEFQSLGLQAKNASLDKVFIEPHFLKTDYKSEKERLQGLEAGLREPVELKPSPTDDEISVKMLFRESLKKPALLLADPGGGKSTFLRWIAKTCAEKFDSTKPESSDNLQRFPIWIQSGDISATCNGEEAYPYPLLYAAAEKSADRAGLNQGGLFPDNEMQSFMRLVRDKVRSGTILFLIDGLDEISDKGLRTKFVRELDSFAAKNAKAGVMASLRYTGFDALSALDENAIDERFLFYQIAPLNRMDVENLCRKWFALRRRADKAERAYHKFFDAIINNENAARLAVNPLMLTVMLLFLGRFGRIPSAAATLYAGTERLLMERWAEDSNLSAPLDTEEARLQLAYIAFYVGMDKTDEISESDLLGLLKRMRQEREELFFQNNSNQDFLRNIQTKNALLLPGGTEKRSDAGGGGKSERYYVFQHRVLREYFAALSVERKCYPHYQPTDRPLNAFGEKALEPDISEIIVLCAGMSADCARMLAEDLMERLKKETQYGSEKRMSIRGLLLRFLSESVPLKTEMVDNILESVFPDGINRLDVRPLYWILRGRYGGILRTYFSYWGRNHYPEMGGEHYWDTLLDILSGEDELRDVYEYYWKYRKSANDLERMKAVCAVSDAIWMPPYAPVGKEKRDAQSSEANRPGVPELNPAQSLLRLSEEKRHKLAQELLDFAADDDSVAVRWHALRALHQGCIRDLDDFLLQEDYPAYFQACAQFIADEGKLPVWNPYFLCYALSECPPLETGLSPELEHGLKMAYESLSDDSLSSHAESYRDSLAFFLLSWHFQADESFLQQVLDFILKVSGEIMTGASEEEDAVRLTFRFAQALLEKLNVAYDESEPDCAMDEYWRFFALSFCQILLPALRHLKSLNYADVGRYIEDKDNAVWSHFRYNDGYSLEDMIQELEKGLQDMQDMPS